MLRIVLILAATLLVVLALHSLVLWLISRLLRFPVAAFSRAVTVTILTALAGWVLLLIDGLLAPVVALPGRDVLFTIAGLVVLYALIRRAYTVPTGRAAAGALIFLVAGTLATLVVVLPMRAYAVIGFRGGSGGMAPTILGQHVQVECPGLSRPIAMGIDPATLRPAPWQRPTVACPVTGARRGLGEAVQVLVGDRFLVDRLGTPRRWDLLVFEAPHAPEQTYVMRLVGLPGETIVLAGGDVFVDGRRLVKGPDELAALWLPVHDTDEQTITGDEAGAWRIAEGSGWARAGHGWSLARPSPDGARLEFALPITDALPYNLLVPPGRPGRSQAVGDVRVEVELGRLAGAGELAVEWTYGDRRLVASIVASGAVVLRANDEEKTATLDGPVSGACRLTLAMRDGAATVLVDGRVVVQETVEPVELAAVADANEPPVRQPGRLAVVARDCEVTVTRLRVARDVHYAPLRPMRGRGDTTMRASAAAPFTLGDGEHFVLGDNTVASLDSRLWFEVAPRYLRTQRGAVPREAIIGVARVIYWPPGRWRILRAES